MITSFTLRGRGDLGSKLVLNGLFLRTNFRFLRTNFRGLEN